MEVRYAKMTFNGGGPNGIPYQPTIIVLVLMVLVSTVPIPVG